MLDTTADEMIAPQPGRSRYDRPVDEGNAVIIVTSTEDPASQNIALNLVAGHGFLESKTKGMFVHPDGNVRVVTIDKPCIYAEPSDIPYDGSSAIFASKHVSSTNRPAMTVHATGNLTRNTELGGEPEEVSRADPAIARRALQKLKERVTQERLDIDVTMEATHHGPTSITVPVCFVEIGSGPKQWADSKLGMIAADAIIEAAIRKDGKARSAVGFGGTHYASKYTRVCLEGDYQIGHIVPRHAFEAGISDTVIKDTIRKRSGPCRTALVDWKGLNGGNRRKLMASQESWGYDAIRC